MRWLASALVALAVGCGGAVPLDSDGGGTAPSSCEPLVPDGGLVGVVARVAGARTVIAAPPSVSCCPESIDSGRYTCVATGSGARVAFALAFPPAARPARAALGNGVRLERVEASGGADTSAWGGDLALQPAQPVAMGVRLDAYGSACSAAGSALFVGYAFLTFWDFGAPACR